MRWKWILTVTWGEMIFSSIPLRNAICSVLSLLLVKSHKTGNMANITHLTNSKIRTGLKQSVVCQIMLDFDRRLSALEKIKLNISFAFWYALSRVQVDLGPSCLGYEFTWVPVVWVRVSWVWVDLSMSYTRDEMSWVWVVLDTNCPDSIQNRISVVLLIS